jgi:hypothetical protein
MTVSNKKLDPFIDISIVCYSRIFDKEQTLAVRLSSAQQRAREMKSVVPLLCMLRCSAIQTRSESMHTERPGEHAPLDRPTPDAFVRSIKVEGALNKAFDGVWTIQDSPMSPLGFPAYVLLRGNVAYVMLVTVLAKAQPNACAYVLGILITLCHLQVRTPHSDSVFAYGK